MSRRHRGRRCIAAQPAVRLKRPMGEQAVKADGDPERAEQVHDGEHDHVAGAKEVVPQQQRRRDDAAERQHDGGDVDVALQTGHVWVIPA